MFLPGKHLGPRPWHGFPSGFAVCWSSPGKLQPPLKSSLSCGKARGENSHSSAVRDWDGRGPATVPGCSCTRKCEKQYRVLILLIECHSHTENVWWVPCHKPPAPSGWGGTVPPPFKDGTSAKYTWKGPGGFSRTVPSGVW